MDNIRRIIVEHGLIDSLNELFNMEHPETGINFIYLSIHDSNDKKTMKNFIQSEGIEGLEKYVNTDVEWFREIGINIKSLFLQ